jgi:hypothetical protein
MKKSIAIIGEGETEWFYFESLRVACRYPYKLTPGFPQHADIEHILKLAKAKLAEHYDYVVCLIDMDRLYEKPAEMKKYLSFKSRKENRDIMFVETSPCTEFWFLLHFLPDNTIRRYQNYDQLIPELRKYMPGYEKTKRYFIKTKLYDFLRANGNLDCAKENADRLSSMSKASPEDRIAYSEIHKVLDLLDNLNR